MPNRTSACRSRSHDGAQPPPHPRPLSRGGDPGQRKASDVSSTPCLPIISPNQPTLTPPAAPSTTTAAWRSPIHLAKPPTAVTPPLLPRPKASRIAETATTAATAAAAEKVVESAGEDSSTASSTLTPPSTASHLPSLSRHGSVSHRMHLAVSSGSPTDSTAPVFTLGLPPGTADNNRNNNNNGGSQMYHNHHHPTTATTTSVNGAVLSPNAEPAGGSLELVSPTDAFCVSAADAVWLSQPVRRGTGPQLPPSIVATVIAAGAAAAGGGAANSTTVAPEPPSPRNETLPLQASNDAEVSADAAVAMVAAFSGVAPPTSAIAAAAVAAAASPRPPRLASPYASAQQPPPPPPPLSRQEQQQQPDKATTTKQQENGKRGVGARPVGYSLGSMIAVDRADNSNDTKADVCHGDDRKEKGEAEPFHRPRPPPSLLSPDSTLSRRSLSGSGGGGGGSNQPPSYVVRRLTARGSRQYAGLGTSPDSNAGTTTLPTSGNNSGSNSGYNSGSNSSSSIDPFKPSRVKTKLTASLRQLRDFLSQYPPMPNEERPSSNSGSVVCDAAVGGRQDGAHDPAVGVDGNEEARRRNISFTRDEQVEIALLLQELQRHVAPPSTPTSSAASPGTSFALPASATTTGANAEQEQAATAAPAPPPPPPTMATRPVKAEDIKRSPARSSSIARFHAASKVSARQSILLPQDLTVGASSSSSGSNNTNPITDNKKKRATSGSSESSDTAAAATEGGSALPARTSVPFAESPINTHMLTVEGRYKQALKTIEEAAADCDVAMRRVQDYSESLYILVETWMHLHDNRFEEFAVTVLERLLAQCPEYRVLFHATNIPKQALVIMDMIGRAVVAFTRPADLMDIMGEMGARHNLYGVHEEHFLKFRAAFFEVYVEFVGPATYRRSVGVWKMFWKSLVELAASGAKSERGKVYSERRFKVWAERVKKVMKHLIPRQHGGGFHRLLQVTYEHAVEQHPQELAQYKQFADIRTANRSMEALIRIVRDVAYSDTAPIISYHEQFDIRHLFTDTPVTFTASDLLLMEEGFLDACETYTQAALWDDVVRAALKELWSVYVVGYWTAQQQKNTHGNKQESAPDGKEPFCLLFTDIEASTRLWDADTHAMSAAITRHHKLVRGLIEDFGGYEVKTVGDSFLIATNTVTQALLIAFGIQLELMTEPSAPNFRMVDDPQGVGDASCWRDDALRVRVGIHYCTDASAVYDSVHGRFDYYGPSVNCAARVEAIACGGQVMLSEDAYEKLNTEEAYTTLPANRLFLEQLSKLVQAQEARGIVMKDAQMNWIVDAVEKDKRAKTARTTLRKAYVSSAQLQRRNSHGEVMTLKTLTTVSDEGVHPLKGIAEPVRLFSLLPEGLVDREFPDTLMHSVNLFGRALGSSLLMDYSISQ